MAEETKTRPRHKGLSIGTAIGVVLLGALVSLAWYLRSPRFADLIRRKVITALQQATGGRVEMTSFRWNLSRLAFEADDLTIHGLEPAGQTPYAHVDRTLIRLHIISFFEKRFNLEQVDLQHPVIHIIVYPDGTTNAPQPKIKPSSKATVQQLFDLAIARADLRDGVLLLNQQTLPLDFAANDVVASMSYDPGGLRYDGSVQVGKMDVKYAGYRDVPAHADLQFALWHNRAEVKSLHLTSQASSLQVSGNVTDFAAPRVRLTYAGKLNVAQLGAVIRTPQLRGGTLRLEGSGGYSEAGGYESAGQIAIGDLNYLDNGLVLRHAGLNSDFSLAGNRLLLTQIAARMLGGRVTGDAEVSILATEQQGSARLRVSGLSLNELARTISTRALPLDKLHAVGSVTGAVNLTWKQAPANAFADLALDIAAPQRVTDGQLPLSGNVRGRYSVRAESINLAALNLTMAHSHLEAAGALGVTSAALKLNVSTSLAEFQPLLRAMSNALPVELAGEASFNGTLKGRLRAPQIAGQLQATNFTYIYTPASNASSPLPPPKRRSWFHRVSNPTPPSAPQPAVQPRRIHIDQFSGGIQYSQSGVALRHTVIQAGGAQLNIDGSSALDRGKFTETSHFQVQAAMHNADVAALQRALGLDYPLSGKLNFKIQAAGTEADPHGHGSISLTDGQAQGISIHSLASQISFANQAVQFQDIHLRVERGTVSGSGGYSFHSREVKLDLAGKSIDLAEIPELQRPRLQSTGVADFTVKGSGTLEAPVINAHLEIASLVLNGDKVGNLTADAVTHGRQLTLTARSRFPEASFALDGNVDLQGDLPANATLKFTNLNVNPFLPATMRRHVTRRASLDGQAYLSGPLQQPQFLQGDVKIQQFSAEIDHIPVKSEGEVELLLANQVVTVQHCTMVSRDTHFTLTGTASLKDDRPLNLRGQGTLNLQLAETLNPDFTSYGVSNIDLTIRGTASAPAISGRVDVVHAGLTVIDLPTGLGDLNGTLLFSQDRLELKNMTGRIGGGRVKLGGVVTYGRTIGFNLSADGNDVRLRYSGISMTSDQTLRLTGTMQNALLSGHVTVTRFAQIPAADLQYLLAQATAPPSIPNPNSPLHNLHLEVRILSTPELTVQTSLARLSGDIDLRLRGTGARPILLGRVSIAEGDISIAGGKYHLERGDITFLNPTRIDPVLDLEATTRVRDYDITIGLHGTMERLNTTYRSDPPLSTDDIISLLAFGRTETENATGATSSAGLAQGASGALLSSALNQAVTNRVSKLFGGSTIRINPAFAGAENDPYARLTVEQQVTNNVTLTIVTDLARSAQEIIQFEYNVNREYTVQGMRDENGVVSFDLLVRKRKP
jgi:translocation and assembly module TamB